jgi:hypothetical protein
MWIVWPRRHGLPEPGADAREELRKLEAAVDQLERAELYVTAALEVGLADPFRRRLLEDLLTRMIATRRSLARPRVLDEGAPPSA